MYESTGLPLLRFYVTASKKGNQNDSVDDSDIMKNTLHTDFKDDEGDDSTVAIAIQEINVLEDLTATQFIDLGTPTVQARREIMEPEVCHIEEIESDITFPIVDDIFTLAGFESFPDEPVTDAAENIHTIKLHRGQVLKELTEYFKTVEVTGTVHVQMVMSNGTMEAGEDAGGVLRDALSEYWEDFYQQNTTGDSIKVPCVRDNMKKEDWEACAKVLAKGYEQEGYFPYKLATPFLTFTMNGDDTANNQERESLIPYFLEFVSVYEKKLFQDALDDFEAVDKDELFDVLETYKVRRHVRPDNFRDILSDAAHRTIIQSTAYICRCWHPVFKCQLKPALNGSLEDVCKQAIPSTKRVSTAIILPNSTTTDEINTGKFLMKYIRSLTQDKLSAFMRYTTGADLMLGRMITVRYVEQTEFERRPMAHTCGCVLELATTFRDFIEFRSEFDSVLENRVWVMDIV